MDVQEEVLKRFESEVVQVCERIFTEGVRQMRRSMEYAGLKMTEDLIRSLYAEQSYVSGELEVQFKMGMNGYGRFKDMKKLNYAHFADLDGIIEFVESIGIEKFIFNETVRINGKDVQLWVPGYLLNTRRRTIGPVNTRAFSTARVAYAFGRSKQIQNTIKRAKDPFYNVNKGEIYTDIIEYLMKELPADMMQALKDYYERPFYDKEGYHE